MISNFLQSWFWSLLQKMVSRVYLDLSFCASSNATLRDFSSWSASLSLTLRTASWPSLAERASVRSSTCDRNSRNVRSVWDCSEFHLSARSLAWFNSASVENNLIDTEADMQKCRPSLFPIYLFTCRLASLLLSGWLKPSPGWGRPPHCAAAGSPDADWTRSGSVAPLWGEEAPACWTPEGRPSLSLNSQVCLWRLRTGEERTHTKNKKTKQTLRCKCLKKNTIYINKAREIWPPV